MEKWIVEFNGKKSDPVSMVRVFHKAVSMYVKEKGVVSKKEVLSELVPLSRMYSESRRNKLLITKDEYTALVSEHKSNKNRYVYDEPLSLVNENNNSEFYYCSTQFSDNKNGSLFQELIAHLGCKGFSFIKMDDGDFELTNNVNVITPNNNAIIHGKDSNCYHVRYADNVSEDERVPELASILEAELERIIGYALDVLKLEGLEFERLPVVLKKELPRDESVFISDESKAKMLFNKVNILNQKPTLEEINRIISKDTLITKKHGSYYSFPKHIVIFFNNFDAQNIEEYISKIIGVLAHEVFHFIHNLIITDDKFDKNDENAVILKEALADFFSYSYLIFNQRKRTYHINTARNMFNNWVEYFGSPWKYAYALYFFIINKKYTGFIDDFSQLNTLGIIDKFKDVLYRTNQDNTSISLLKLIN